MFRLVRFLPLVLLVLFVAWCSHSGERKREQGPQRVELTELFLQQGLITGPISGDGGLAKAATRAGRSGMNQLFYNSVTQASIESLRWMIDHGAEPASIGAPEGVPLLHKAAQTPNAARLEFLLGLGLDARQRGPNGNTVLHTAAAAGVDEHVLKIMLSKGLKLGDTNAAGQQPIHLANVKSIDVLVRNGAEVDAVDGLGRTALHQAASDKRADLAVELLRVGASVFKTDSKGRTPLHLAALSRSEPVVDALLAAGAPRSARDADGQTARDLAQAPTSSSRYSGRYRSFADKL
jgi:ankyrin repeat protein